jgi:hypothetical protein
MNTKTPNAMSSHEKKLRTALRAERNAAYVKRQAEGKPGYAAAAQAHERARAALAKAAQS